MSDHIPWPDSAKDEINRLRAELAEQTQLKCAAERKAVRVREACSYTNGKRFQLTDTGAQYVNVKHILEALDGSTE